MKENIEIEKTYIYLLVTPINKEFAANYMIDGGALTW